MKKSKFPIEIEVFRSYSSFININLSLDCNDLIDWYSYHDAPLSVNWYPTRDELIKLKELVDIALQKYDELEKENKNGN